MAESKWGEEGRWRKDHGEERITTGDMRFRSYDVIIRTNMGEVRYWAGQAACWGLEERNICLLSPRWQGLVGTGWYESLWAGRVTTDLRQKRTQELRGWAQTERWLCLESEGTSRGHAPRELDHLRMEDLGKNWTENMFQSQKKTENTRSFSSIFQSNLMLTILCC